MEQLEKEQWEERYLLSRDRIKEISMQAETDLIYRDYFQKTAAFLCTLDQILQQKKKEKRQEVALHVWEERNEILYGDIKGNAYEKSYANPSYATEKLGINMGRILSFLYTELRAGIAYVYENRMQPLVIQNELFLEIYQLFVQEIPEYRQVKDAIYWFFHDYSELTVPYRIQELVDPGLTFATDIIMDSDLTDLSYLYYYGEYIGENEIKTAQFLNRLPQEEIEKIAFTYTDGYREGFVLAGIDLSEKKTVNIRYPIGMERIVRAAIGQFRQMGLDPVIYRYAVSSINKKQNIRIGYCSTSPNRQYDYDHRLDMAVYFDKTFMERKLVMMKKAYEMFEEEAYVHAGPACIEGFGETIFEPQNKDCVYSLTQKQQKLEVEYSNKASEIVNTYIPGEKRSFTIIAFPLPEIGEKYEEIFHEIVKVNTLDKALYKKIQQKIIDTLDQAKYVTIKGMNGNETNLSVALTTLHDPDKETIFENCLADVNIPVGEVFTSPKLAGTNGILHVKKVYLNDLCYHNLRLEFTDGKITEYNCTNFEEENKNKEFIKENLLFHHETLPMGEFAIGTNTTAYVMAKKYNIMDRLPILIAEKTGPHFAVGDTCYSYAEDKPVYNPDGKEIIARDNECSALRKEDVEQAYFHCHTDITIPYEELGSIVAVTNHGLKSIIENGKFVLPGTEELNTAFE